MPRPRRCLCSICGIPGHRSTTCPEAGNQTTATQPQQQDSAIVTPAFPLGRGSRGRGLKMPSFTNPNRFMEGFDPEHSSREMRKMNRKIYRENLRKNQMYDDTGKLLDDSRDVCDCLEEDCDGCHFPCLKCDSTKCGHECRCSRRWIYEQVQIEGSKASFYFPMS